jgi:hypothetical protein
MTRIELIEFIGDVITKLDVLAGSMLPNNPNQKIVMDAREELDAKHLKLVQNIFNDNTQKFKDATEKIVEINKDLKKTIADLDKLVTTLENINKFIGAVDKLIQAVIP